MQEPYIPRHEYLNRIEPYIGKEPIKALVGQRRVGKSYLLLQIRDLLLERFPRAPIIHINKELHEFSQLRSEEDLVAYVCAESGKAKRAMKKTNFDLYLEEQLKDPVFAERFEAAGEAWDVALQLAALREQAGLSQKELARKLGTSQQNISRLESPAYEGHSLAMLRRVAKELKARVRIVFELDDEPAGMRVAEERTEYKVRRKPSQQS